MLVRVLVVDDSAFFRRRVTEMLETDPRIKVIGTADNGSEAVQKANRLKPDVITMDVEMPLLDGITATKRILAHQQVSILMFSSLTTEGARATLDALEAGAVDFLPKRFEDISNDKAMVTRQLCEKVVAVARLAFHPLHHSVDTGNVKGFGGNSAGQRAIDGKSTIGASYSVPSYRTSSTGIRSGAAIAHRAGQPNTKKGQFKLVLIGTSTGGPVALQKVLTQVPKDFSAPILLVQHMPGSFTSAFAQRLDSLCAINVKEAEDGDELKSGTALLAPGGKQMELEKRASKWVVRIKNAEPGQNYKPCVDITFNSAAKFDPLNTLAIIMTGMGSDGAQACKLLKTKGATVWVQNEKTCVVYGMPAAVAEAGVADSILSVDEIGINLAHRA